MRCLEDMKENSKRGKNRITSFLDLFRKAPYKKRRIQFSPLKDITAYELAKIIQIDNTVKSLHFANPDLEYLHLLSEHGAGIQRHFLLEGKRLHESDVRS